MTSSRRRASLLRAHMVLGRTRRQGIRRVSRTERASRRTVMNLALRDLAGALTAHRLRPRAIREYLDAAIRPSLPRLRRDEQGIARRFAAESAAPPKEERENPLKGAREAAAYFITSPRLRALQGRITGAAFADWYGLNVSGRQEAVLGCYSDTAWLARGLMKSAGLPMESGRLTIDDRHRLMVVLEPYVRGLDLRRAHLEGLSRPGRAVLATLSQRRRIGRLERRGFSPEDLKVLYPEILDRETLRYRCESVENLRDDALRLVSARETGTRFENYLHLQTLILGAPSRSPRRLGRFLAAVEIRHAA